MVGAVRQGGGIAESEVRDLCAREVARWGVRGKRVLMIVPDNTRTAPIDVMFRVLHEILALPGQPPTRGPATPAVPAQSQVAVKAPPREVLFLQAPRATGRQAAQVPKVR